MNTPRLISLFVSRCFILSLFAYSASAENYYLDRSTGNNANSGLKNFPWKSMERVNTFEFQPGDIIHLRRGETWQGESILLTESGNPASPIKVTNYGSKTAPLPVLMGAAPLSEEFKGTWDLDIHTVNIGAVTDDFLGWADSAVAPSSIKADIDTYLGSGVSAKMQYGGGVVPRIWRRMPIAVAADLPIVFRLRFKVESGDLTLKINNLNTGNYYNQSGAWGPNAAAAVFSSTQYSNWSEVSLVVPNDAALGQLQLVFSANGIAFLDDVSLSTQWVEHAPNLYKRAIIAHTTNGIYSVYREEVLVEKRNNVAAFTQNFNWTIDANERALYMRYSGALEELNAEPLLVDRGSFYAIDLFGTDLIVDGLQVEKTSVGIRPRNDNAIIENNYIRHAGRCGVLAYKLEQNIPIAMYNATTRNNVVENSSCGIYYWRVHNSLVRGNTLNNIRDRGYGVDIEVLGLQSVTNSVIEYNVGSDAIIGIDLWGGPGYPAYGNSFRYNTMHGMDYVGILMGGTQDNHGVAGGSVRGYVYGNVVHHNLCFNNGFGIGFESRGSGMRQNNTPREEDGPNYWYNNTMHANQYNFSGSSGFAGRFVFRNNISLAPAQGHLELPGSPSIYNDLTSAELSHNIYYPDGESGYPLFDWHGEYDAFSIYQVAAQKDLNGSVVDDPSLVNPTVDILTADFSLQGGSPAVDAGIDVGIAQDFINNPIIGVPDIGAYELVDTDGDGIIDLNDNCPTEANPNQTDSDGDSAGNVCDPEQITFISIATEDGWVRESTENSNVGGKSNAAGAGDHPIRFGDNNRDRQFKAIVSFDTSPLPVGTKIQMASLELTQGTFQGNDDPYATFGNASIDLSVGGFSGDSALSKSDFEAQADVTLTGVLTDNGTLGTANLDATGQAAIEGSNLIQLRIAFELDDNDDGSRDYTGYFSGDNSDSGKHPRLVIDYTLSD